MLMTMPSSSPQRNGGDDVGQQAADILAHQRAELAHAAYLVIQDEQRQVDKDAQCGEQQGSPRAGREARLSGMPANRSGSPPALMEQGCPVLNSSCGAHGPMASNNAWWRGFASR